MSVSVFARRAALRLDELVLVVKGLLLTEEVGGLEATRIMKQFPLAARC